MFLSTILFATISLSAQEDKNKIHFNYPLAFVPDEIKYGGLFNEAQYLNQFYVSYNLLAIALKSSEGMYSFVAPGISYSRINNHNYLSLYPSYEKQVYYFNLGFKIEPLYNLSTRQVDYLNFEAHTGLFLNLSLTCGIPANKNVDSAFIGFKIGYTLTQAIFYTEKFILQKERQKKKHNK